MSAFCAMDWRIADTSHKIMRSLANLARTPARGGNFPLQKGGISSVYGKALDRLRNKVGI
ncbi:MAG: hypothetical protein ACOX8U_05895 [Bradymonadia bacterium]